MVPRSGGCAEQDTCRLLLDVHIPGKSGLDILKELHGEDYPAPIFMISGKGDSPWPSARSRAARWTHRKAVPRQRTRRASERGDRRLCPPEAASSGEDESLHSPREPLTRREREVLEQFPAGASNKEAGRSLGISPRTIEDHREYHEELSARNAADLVRIVMTAARS